MSPSFRVSGVSSGIFRQVPYINPSTEEIIGFEVDMKIVIKDKENTPFDVWVEVEVFLSENPNQNINQYFLWEMTDWDPRYGNPQGYTPEELASILPRGKQVDLFFLNTMPGPGTTVYWKQVVKMQYTPAYLGQLRSFFENPQINRDIILHYSAIDKG